MSAKLGGALLLSLLLSACSVIDMHTAAPADWPKLEVNTYKAGFLEVQKWCGNSMPLLKQVAGCARIRFDLMRCDIWLVNSTPDYEELIIEHEMEHCKGRDHVGSSYLRNLWERYKNYLHDLWERYKALTKGE